MKVIFSSMLFGLFFSSMAVAQNNESEMPSTTIEFEQETFDFGVIRSGELVKNVYEFTNTGTEPLVISNVKGSCGCTVPEWPKEAIGPGETGYILAVFNSKGKKGNQQKRISITANTEQSLTYLTLKGKVEEKASAPLKNLGVDANAFTIFPNPASDIINIKMDGHLGETANIEIFDNASRLVKTSKIDKITTANHTIQINDFEKGVYTVSIKIGDKMRLAKQFIVM